MNASQISKRYDVVIVGSGHNGLVAAAYLAKAGLSVLVLERNAELGGATTSQRVFPDYDALLSRYSYLVSLFSRQIIDELGLNFRTARRQIASFTPYQSKEGRPNGLLISNENPKVSRDSFLEMTGSDRTWSGYSRLLSLEHEFASLVWPSLLKPLQNREYFKQRLSTEDLKAAWSAFVERPLGEVFEELIDHDLARGLVMTDGKIGVFTHPHDPTLLQNRCFLYHVVGNGTGEWQVPIGGMCSLVNSLLEVGRNHGAQFFTSANVTAVEQGAAEHIVHFEFGEKLTSVAASRVLFNAGPRTQHRLLGTGWQAASQDEGSVTKMNMLLRRLPKLKAAGVAAEEAFCGSLHLNEGYDQMHQSYLVAMSGRLPEVPPCEVYCHTLTDGSILSPNLRSAGYHTLTLFGLDVPYRLFVDDNEKQKSLAKDKYLDALDEICSDSFRDCLALDRNGEPCVELKSPIDLEKELDLDQGNIFHKSLEWFFTDDESKQGKWGVETEYPRIYLSGASAHRGGAVSGIPGRNVAACIFEELGVAFP